MGFPLASFQNSSKKGCPEKRQTDIRTPWKQNKTSASWKPFFWVRKRDALTNPAHPPGIDIADWQIVPCGRKAWLHAKRRGGLWPLKQKAFAFFSFAEEVILARPEHMPWEPLMLVEGPQEYHDNFSSLFHVHRSNKKATSQIRHKQEPSENIQPHYLVLQASRSWHMLHMSHTHTSQVVA